MMKVSAFRMVPPFAQGLVRDLRVRWALEEAGMQYEEMLVGAADLATPGYRALQPFGQVPAIETEDMKLFESGAIVLHIAERSEALMPRDPRGRARTAAWVIAALNSVEPAVQALGEIDFFHAGEEWTKQRRPQLLERAEKRLGALEAWLGGKDYLEGRFTAGDLMMTTVLRLLRDTDIVSSRPVLAAYQQRCEARPAFDRALAAHMRPFKAAA